MTDEERIERGRKALDLKKNDVFIEAVGAVRNRLFVEWARAKQTEQREKLHSEYEAIERIVSELSRYIDDLTLIQHRQEMADKHFGIE